jgi:hypothetical protein
MFLRSSKGIVSRAPLLFVYQFTLRERITCSSNNKLQVRYIRKLSRLLGKSCNATT